MADEHLDFLGTSLLGHRQMPMKGGFFDVRGVKLPVAVSAFPDEIYAAPQSWAEKAYAKLIHYNKLPKGGHFAAWEQPQLFCEESRVVQIASRINTQPSNQIRQYEYDRSVRTKHRDPIHETALHRQSPHDRWPRRRLVPFVGWPARRKTFSARRSG